MSNEIYLDNGMTTKPSAKAISAMVPFYNKYWGTPSAPHEKGNELLDPFKKSLKNIYGLLEANENDSFIFTSSGAEAVNQVILSAYFNTAHHSGKNQIITSAIDEAPTLMAISRLEQLSCTGKMVEADASGKISVGAIMNAISPRTALVSLAWANGLTGVINPIADIANALQEKNIPLHVDVSHVLGKLWLPENLPAAYLTFNGDLIHAPQGTGGVLIKEGYNLSPLILGGVEQNGLRAGAMNIPGIVALGVAAQEAMETRDLMALEVARLRNKLELGLKSTIADCEVLFQEQERVPNITAIGFDGVVNEALLYLLNQKNVYACIGGGSFQQLTLVAKACGVRNMLAQGCISFNLSRSTTDEEIDRTIEIVAASVNKLRKIAAKVTNK